MGVESFDCQESEREKEKENICEVCLLPDNFQKNHLLKFERKESLETLTVTKIRLTNQYRKISLSKYSTEEKRFIRLPKKRGKKKERERRRSLPSESLCS